MEKVEVTGIHIDNVTIDEGVARLEEFLDSESYNMVFTPNSEMLVDAVKSIELGDILNKGNLVIPDGIGVVIASKFYKTPLKERVTGFDLMGKLIELAYRKNKKIYLLGGAEGIAADVASKLEGQYAGFKIAGIQNGYFADDEEDYIIDEINKSRADILLVALGAPKQEKFIYRNRRRLNVRIAMGVGGCFDVLAGKVPRAPEAYQKLGLEWFYRFLKEPSRFGRILKLPKFIALAFFDSKFRG